MKKTARLMLLIALVAVISLTFVAVAFADDGDESQAQDERTRVEIINEMGYDFPMEGDTEIPKYKVVYPDGTEKISYVATKLYDDARFSPSGSTIVLLSDLYQSTTYINQLHNPEDATSMDPDEILDLKDDIMQVVVDSSRTLNFDFAGHTIFTEYKMTFFSCSGSSNLNVYSSAPGARLIALVEAKDTGGSVITLSSGNANIGDFSDENGNVIYPGENLSTYSAGGFVVSGGVLNVTGITAYRVATDYVSYIGVSGRNAVANFTRSRFFGVGRYLQIACREDGDKNGRVYGNVFTFQDCTISNIGSPSVVTGPFFRYIADDNEFYFNNTVFDTVGFSCQRYYSHDGYNDLDGNPLPAATAVVAFDKNCSYNQLPDVKSITEKAESSRMFGMYRFPEVPEGYGERGSGIPEYILSDGVIEDVHAIVMNPVYAEEHGIQDFRMHNLLEDYDLSGMYTLPYVGYEEDVIEVTWEFHGATSDPELWIKGETPTPYTMQVPRDTEYIQYVTSKVYENEDIALYTISPQVNLTLKVNYTFSDKVYVNAYVPVYDDLAIDDFVYKFGISGTSTKIAEIKESCEIVEIDGGQYCKIVTPIDYERMTDKYILTIDVANRSKTGSSFTITKRISFSDAIIAALDGEGSQEFKDSIGNVLYYIHKNSTNPGAVSAISAVVNERYADRIAAEAADTSGNFFTDLIDKIKALLGA